MRTEHDTLGEVGVPDDALYGASTARAVRNFPISGHPMPEAFIHALARVKSACASANRELGRLSADKANAICTVAAEIVAGGLQAQFPVDVFQTGSGTSTNTNINEVIANRASQLAGLPSGGHRPLHPNDDVNLGQSSNDVMPTALHVAVALQLRERLRPALVHLQRELEGKAAEFAAVVKPGRTHLMDAAPVTLGQEFSGYAVQAGQSVVRTDRAIMAVHELAIGGTAVGTGLNGHPGFARRVCALLSADTGIEFGEARNHFEAQAARDASVEVAGLIATIAGSLAKVADDLCLLGSGPHCGLGEIRLPAVQPGSSIMPGKTNPVHCEMLLQVALYVQGLTQVVVQCGREGRLELNTTIPLIAFALLESIRCLAHAVRVFAADCVRGIEADAAHCLDLAERSPMIATPLTPHLGYELTAELVREAALGDRSLRSIVRERRLLDDATLDRALDLRTMAGLPPGSESSGGDPRE